MASLNKAQIIGKLGKDPEVTYSSSGLAIGKFSIATNRRVKGSDGNWEDATDWHNVTAFGKMAENAQRRMKTGSCCYVEGRIQTDKYVDREGVTRYITKIVASDIQPLDGRAQQERSEPMPRSERQASQSQETEPTKQTRQGWKDGGSLDDQPEDLPF